MTTEQGITGHGATGHGHNHEHEHWHEGHRTHKFDPANLERLLGPARQQLLPVEPVLRAAGIAPGQTVVDLGSGPGYFTLPIAQLVGERGRVVAADIQPELLEICARRAREAGLRQVETVHAEESRVPLPDGIADRVFVSLVLHEADEQVAFLREARRLLKPGGEVALVEWAKQDGPPGPPAAHRVSAEDVGQLAATAGLSARPAQPVSAHHYLMRLS